MSLPKISKIFEQKFMVWPRQISLKKFLVLVLFVGLTTSFSAVEVSSCAWYSPEEEIKSSDIIFIGRLIDTNQDNTVQKFVPYKVWKSDFEQQTIEIKSTHENNGGVQDTPRPFYYLGPCSMLQEPKYPFLSSSKIDQEYLIFAKKSGDSFIIHSIFSNSLPLDFRIKDKSDKLIGEIDKLYTAKNLTQNFGLFEKTNDQKQTEHFVFVTTLAILGLLFLATIFFWYFKIRTKKSQ